MQTVSTDYWYQHLVDVCWNWGDRLTYRNGDRKRLICPGQIRFDKTPLVSLRKTAWKSALREMEWFLSGSNKLADLHPSVHHWWLPWVNEQGRVAMNYGEQLRNWTVYKDIDAGQLDTIYRPEPFDCIAAFIDGIKKHPHSSRHVITTWNTPEMYSDECMITNCHGTVIQGFVTNGVFDLFMYQRSADVVLGLQHNWIQYWAFAHWVAHRTGNKLRAFIWQGGDVHVYVKHQEMIEKILAADHYRELALAPELIYEPTSEDKFFADDFRLAGDYSPFITDPLEMVV